MLIVLTALLPLAGFPAWVAQAAPAVPPADLAALLAEAEANSPALRAAEARVSAARHLPSQAETSPDPEVSVSYTNDGVSSFTLGDSVMSNLALTWRQEFPYPGKLKKAGEVAAAGVEVADRDLARIRLEILSQVKTAYAELYRLDTASAILDETKGVLESLAEVARRRYEVGQGIQENVLKAQTEILRLEAELARVTQDRKAAEARLNAAVGRSAPAPVGPAVTLPGYLLPASPEEIVEAAVSASPVVAGQEAGVRREEARLRLARLDLKPDFVWSATYMNRDGLDPMVMGMFGARLPIHSNKKQAEAVLQTESDLSSAQQELLQLRIRIRAEVQELLARVERADRLSQLFGQGIVPQARSALESAQASYQVGRLAFLDLLNDLTLLLNARIELAAQEADRIQALAALEPLAVRELIRVPAPDKIQGGDDDKRD